MITLADPLRAHTEDEKPKKKLNKDGEKEKECLDKSGNESQETGSVEAGNERGKEAGGGEGETCEGRTDALCLFLAT